MENDKLLQHVALEQAQLLGRFNTFMELHSKQHEEQNRKSDAVALAVNKVEGSCAVMAAAITGRGLADEAIESSRKMFLAIISILVVAGAAVGGIISQIIISQGG